MENKFEVGDIVTLKSGGHRAVVTSVEKSLDNLPDRVGIVWVTSSEDIRTLEVPATCLVNCGAG